MKTKILVMLLAMLATISNAACKVGEIQLNGSNACVTDCGKYWESSKVTFRNCTINQLGTPAKNFVDYYLRLPADTPQKRIYGAMDECIKKGVGCPNPKKKSPQSKRNGRGNGTRHH